MTLNGSDNEEDATLTLSEPMPARVARTELDYYPTPRHVVDAIVPRLPHVRSVFDPACGRGELFAPFREFGSGIECLGIELDPDNACHAGSRVVVGDALTLEWPGADLLIANPPFTLAREFIQRAIDWRAKDPRRTVACLARLTILESDERRVMHQQNPSDVYVLSSRPKFRPGRDGRMATDSVTCVWLVFGPGRGGRWSVL